MSDMNLEREPTDLEECADEFIRERNSLDALAEAINDGPARQEIDEALGHDPELEV